jgi:hypothetical protein
LSHLKAGTKTLSKDLFRPVLSKLEGSIFLVTAVDAEKRDGIPEAYAGNPLALKIVAQTIVEVFGGRTQKQGSLFVWDVQSGECIFAHEEEVEGISAIAWGASEDELISGDSKGKLSWWDIPSGKCVRVREAHQGKIQSLKRSPDGCWLASCGDDGAIMLWNVYHGEHVQTMRRDRPYERLNITGIRGLSKAQKETLHVLGAWEDSFLLDAQHAPV